MMRVTIFWRVIFAQSVPIILLLGMNFYAWTHFNQLSALSAAILSIDSGSIETTKRLLKIFLMQMRNAQKYVHLRDKVFYEHFTQGHRDFEEMLKQLPALVDTPQERSLIEQARHGYEDYVSSVITIVTQKSTWNEDKAILVSEVVTQRLNELIGLREALQNEKMTAARDQAAEAARRLLGLTLAGIAVAFVLAHAHAQAISGPLKKLQSALLRVGKGVFQGNLNVRAPKEVQALAQAFNSMAQQLAELEQMKADFLAHISHDLRTPLTGIHEGTALLLEQIPGPLNRAQQEILDVVRTHSQLLAHSLLSILDLTKMEAGMMEYCLVPSDLRVLLERSVYTVQLLAQTKRLHVHCSTPDELPLVRCDAVRLQQVFNNLLSNAVKFTEEEGTIMVSAAVQSSPIPEDTRVEIRVADTGVGLPTEESERIFERFYQSEFHKERGQRGTGLGLAIARHVVEAHGGKIWVESQVGVGSTFVVTLPIYEDGSQMENLTCATYSSA
jgi:two-component system sensor histidine kinase GlrK